MKFRPEADVNRMMTDDELRALAEDIDEHGQTDSIALYEGDILDGRNRYVAITKYGKKGKSPRFEKVNPPSLIAFVVSKNDRRRHDSEGQRTLASARALPFFEEEARKRQVEAGKQYGKGKAKKDSSAPIGAELSAQRAATDAAAAFNVSTRNAQRGKVILERGSQKLQAAIDRDALSVGKAEQIIKQSSNKKEQDAKLATIEKSKMVTRVKGLTGEIEWYTPRPYLDAAVAVMGAIDLDPASSKPAQEHVKAGKIFTLEDDGLIQPWQGRVFLNPPYRMPTVQQFSERIVQAFKTKEIEEGILLVNNATDTEWFHHALSGCTACCLTRGRISFLEARNGELLEKTCPTHGQAFFYFGRKPEKFCKVFSQFGAVVVLKAEAKGRCNNSEG